MIRNDLWGRNITSELSVRGLCGSFCVWASERCKLIKSSPPPAGKERERSEDQWSKADAIAISSNSCWEVRNSLDLHHRPDIQAEERLSASLPANLIRLRLSRSIVRTLRWDNREISLRESRGGGENLQTPFSDYSVSPRALFLCLSKWPTLADFFALLKSCDKSEKVCFVWLARLT